jgi:hypothetical protein
MTQIKSQKLYRELTLDCSRIDAINGAFTFECEHFEKLESATRQQVRKIKRWQKVGAETNNKYSRIVSTTG